ncbi:G protein-coupled receptor [Sarotherodon galilaeus]
MHTYTLTDVVLLTPHKVAPEAAVASRCVSLLRLSEDFTRFIWKRLIIRHVSGICPVRWHLVKALNGDLGTKA